MDELCAERGVNFWDLHTRLGQVTESIAKPEALILTRAEVIVLRVALEVAGGV